MEIYSILEFIKGKTIDFVTKYYLLCNTNEIENVYNSVGRCPTQHLPSLSWDF